MTQADCFGGDLQHKHCDYIDNHVPKMAPRVPARSLIRKLNMPTVVRMLNLSEQCFPGLTPRALKLKARMIKASLTHREAIAPFLAPPPGTALSQVMAQRPKILGALIWPYQCAAWDAKERLARIHSHYTEVDRMGAPFVFDLDASLSIVDLSDLRRGLRLVIDQPEWFMREGGLVVNIFVGNFRAFSLAFSFYRSPEGQLAAVVGGLQGRNREDALDLYRDLTKLLYGLRPRDFLFEVFRMIGRHCGVDVLHAVCQNQRHHLDPYFGSPTLSLDYDKIWQDRQGMLGPTHFYSFPVAPETRDLSTVKPNKRSLYRKRFAFLDDMEQRVTLGLASAVPTRFVDT